MGCASWGGSPTLYITWGGQDCLLHLQLSSSLAEKGSSLPSNNVGHLTRSTEGPGSQDTLHISQWSGPMNPVFSSRKPWSGLDPNPHHHSFSPFPTCSTQLRTEWFSKVHLDQEITSLTIFWPNDHHPSEPSSYILIAFSSISPKGLLPTFCKFTMSEIFILNLGFSFFLTHCWLRTRILLIKDLATLHGKAFALSNLTPDHFLHRSYKAVSVNESIPWFGIYNRFLVIHLSIALSAFSLSLSPLLESYFVHVAFLNNHCVKPKFLFLSL